MRRAVGIAMLVLAAAACTPTTGGTGGGTTTKPVITGVTVTPNSVAEGGQLTVSWHITDTAPIAGTTLLLRDQTAGSTATITACATAVTLTSGTSLDGEYAATCNVPALQPAGTYLVDIGAIDNLGGNSEDKSTTFTLTGDAGDSAPPLVVSSSYTLTSTSSGAVVTATLHLTDQSGVASVAVDLKDEVGGASGGVGAGTRLTGTATDGTYTAPASVLPGIAAGTYDVIVVATDTLGNAGSTTIGTVGIG